jgi:hypothetical protein
LPKEAENLLATMNNEDIDSKRLIHPQLRQQSNGYTARPTSYARNVWNAASRTITALMAMMQRIDLK